MVEKKIIRHVLHWESPLISISPKHDARDVLSQKWHICKIFLPTGTWKCHKNNSGHNPPSESPPIISKTVKKSYYFHYLCETTFDCFPPPSIMNSCSWLFGYLNKTKVAEHCMLAHNLKAHLTITSRKKKKSSRFYIVTVFLFSISSPAAALTWHISCGFCLLCTLFSCGNSSSLPSTMPYPVLYPQQWAYNQVIRLNLAALEERGSLFFLFGLKL